MAKTVYNKNVANPSDVIASVFSSGDLKYGEVVICNSIDEPGLYIFTKNDGGETRIQKVNSVENIVFDNAIDPTATGPVVSGDSLNTMVSKLQNQIDELEISGSTGDTKVTNVVVGVGLNSDGTYSAITGDYISTATSIAEAIELLDSAITSKAAETLQSAKDYADIKIADAVDSLDAEETAGEGKVFVKITEVNGIVSGDVKSLSVAKNASGLKYDLKLGDYIFGTVDIPQDQFLSGVTFISAATAQDVAEALNYGQTIELGKPYLKFVWILTGGISETFVDVSGLIDVYTAEDIHLSDNYTGTSFNIKSGTTVEDAIGKITNELTNIEETVVANSIESTGKTILVTQNNGKTNLEAHIDNETIVADDSVSKQGEMSVKLDINKQNFDTGYVRTKYTLKSKTGEYGVITDTREILSGSSQFLTVESEPVVDSEGNRTNKTTISPVMVTVDWNDINGMSVQNGNGLATAYEVKQYVKDGIDGDNIFVGNNPVGNLYGRIDFNQSGISYDNVHEAFVRTDNNMVRLDETIGLATDGPDVHLYPSAYTQDCLLISGDTTIMDALKTLDKGIDDMDYSANTGDNKVITGITQTNGHVAVTSENLTKRKLAGYTVGGDDSGKVADTDTLGQALGKLQGQINGLDWTGVTTANEVFTGITEADGKVSATTALITSVKLSGYSATADTKVAASQSLGVALGNLQGQIDSLDYTANTSTDKVFTYVAQKDGKLTTSAETITSRIISGYGTTSDAKVAASDTLGAALGKLQGQIDGMDLGSSAKTHQVVTDVTQADGKVSHVYSDVVSRTLTNLPNSADTKISASDTLGTALANLQGQINAMDASTVAEANSIVSDVTETDGKITATTKHIVDVKLSGYTEGSDADITSAMTLGQALGNLQKQINSMDKTASAATGKFVRTVAEADGKVSETLGFIENTDITVCAATSSEIASLGANVKEAYKLVNANGATQLGEWIKIYKDSSISEIYLGTSADTVNATTGVVDKKSGDKESLNYVYYTVNGTYSMVKIDLETFLTEPEFKSGVTVTNHIAHGVVDTNSESFLTVGANGFKLSGVQNAIDSAIQSLNSSSATSSSNYAITGITIADGKINGIGQTNKIASASTAEYADNAGTVANKTVGNANGNVPLSNGTVNTNLNADMIDGKHVAVVSAIPSSPDANTIYILA